MGVTFSMKSNLGNPSFFEIFGENYERDYVRRLIFSQEPIHKCFKNAGKNLSERIITEETEKISEKLEKGLR